MVYQDGHLLAFRDVKPVAPVHILLIPRRHISGLNDIGPGDRELLGGLLLAASDLARAEGLAEGGYRVVTNTGAKAGQSVDHLHFHLIGGRAMSWPPG
jgi:histidine triad (HIT) family protein